MKVLRAAVIRLLIALLALFASFSASAFDPASWQNAIQLSDRMKGSGKYSIALDYADKALRMAEEGKQPSYIAISLHEKAGVLAEMGQYAKADELYMKSLQISRKAFGDSHQATAKIQNSLAVSYTYQGRFSDAEALYKKSLSTFERERGNNHPHVASLLGNLAGVYLNVGRFQQAESLLLRSINIYETALGNDSPELVESLSNLASIYADRGDLGLAESLLIRALNILEYSLGKNHPDAISILNNLGDIKRSLGKFAEAENLLRRSLAITFVLKGNGHPDLAVAMNNLGTTALSRGQPLEAEKLYRSALAILQEAYGLKHPDVATSATNVATTLLAQQKFSEAESFFLQSLRIREEILGPQHPDLTASLRNLSVMSANAGRLDKAFSYSKRSVRIMRKNLVSSSSSLRSNQMSDYDSQGWVYAFHASLAIDIAKAKSSLAVPYWNEAFESIQLAISSDAGKALAQSAVRFAANNPYLAAKVRTHQDAIARWRLLDRKLIESLGKSSEQRNHRIENDLRQQIALVESEIKRLDEQLQSNFPAYRELTSPEPIHLSDLQKLLGTNEALVTWLFRENEVLLVLVRPERVEFVKTEVSLDQITRLVKKLRIAIEIPAAGDLLPFPHEQAHELYHLLFGQIEKSLEGVKKLILVPDGPLQSLSFGMLKVGPGDTAGKDAPWLARRYALTTLPSITSLQALRKYAKESGQREPFVGFGDPDLKGDDGNTRGVGIARLFARGVVADTRAVSEMQPLPATADELKSIAKSLKADENSIYLREAATETTVKKSPLNKYRTIAFATHGIMAGEFKGVQEPALVLTPPAVGSVEDDGLLTASEVAGLKLDADWVILSACNTAAPDGTPGADGFSGLTKAFFYAGARSLLVSHWAVESNSAMQLTTRMFEEVEKGATKAEALRRSMMALADDPETSHPAFWAPFVVVGEGAR